MSRMKAAVAAAVMAGALAVPATSNAQSIDVAPICHAVLGSGTIDLGVTKVDRCFTANGPTACTLSETINVLNLVRLRTGLCIDLAGALNLRIKARGLVYIHP